MFSKEQLEQFVAQSYTRIDMQSSDLIPKILPTFLEMVQNPPLGSWTFYSNKPGDRDTGLIRKHGEADTDHKVYFHYRTELMDRLEENGTDQEQGFERYVPFLDTCEELFERCRQTQRAFAEELARARPDLRVPPHGTNRTLRYDVLRLLVYRERRQDRCPFDDATDVTARAHRDRNSMSFTIQESHGGLEGARGDKEKIYEPFHEVHSEPNKPIIFVGAKLQDLQGDPHKLPGLVHRVRQVDGQRLNEHVIRCSIVYFGHPQGYGKVYEGSTHYNKK